MCFVSQNLHAAAENQSSRLTSSGKSAVDALDGKIVYINVMNRLSVDCDCDGNPAEQDQR